jgi:hypothetical protein
MAIDSFLFFSHPSTSSTLQTDVTTLVHDIGTTVHQLAGGASSSPVQVPIGTPIALVFIAAALEFLPTIIGGGVGGNLGGSLGGNLGGSKDLLGAIEHDFQHLVTDIVGILHHPQTT